MTIAPRAWREQNYLPGQENDLIADYDWKHGAPRIFVAEDGRADMSEFDARDAWVKARMNPRKPSKKPAGSVYFARAGSDGPIKIGWSREPERRMSALNTSSPVRVELLGVVRARKHLEGQLHARFAKHRLNGEWFSPAQEILDFVRAECGQ